MAAFEMTTASLENEEMSVKAVFARGEIANDLAKNRKKAYLMCMTLIDQTLGQVAFEENGLLGGTA